jgi:hypothetical protein
MVGIAPVMFRRAHGAQNNQNTFVISVHNALEKHYEITCPHNMQVKGKYNSRFVPSRGSGGDETGRCQDSTTRLAQGTHG